MSRIEIDARTLLQERRRALQPSRPALAHAQGGSWSTWDSSVASLPDDARRELAEIDAALSRIEEGRYGVCQTCGGPMGLHRLRAIPEARYCVACSGNHHAAE